ncbi:MAG: V-type ATP synthase subunit A, partial [Candidatus Poseidoniia archaeon]
MSKEGTIYRISGPVVTAIGMNASMFDIVRVGDEGLMGEVIELHGEKAIIQVYEDTSGIRPGEPV